MTQKHTYRDLIRSGSLINGLFVSEGATFDVKNPATGECVAKVVNAGAAEAALAIDAAEAAFEEWRKTTATERAAFLRRWRNLVLRDAEALAELLTREQGKPFAEALGEIKVAASHFEWFAEEARRTYGETIPSDVAGREYVVLHEPVGIAAAITPWNFPTSMLSRKLAPAIAAGCSTVVKPASETPLSALALGVLALEAGAPAGLINIVVGTDSGKIGDVFCDDKRVRKLSFTGSTRVGKLLAQKCAGNLKRLSMELGGDAPFVIFDDADLDLAIAGLITSKFRNSGQTCVCANRIYVQEGVADDILSRLTKAMAAQLRLGNGMESGTTQGPLIHQKAADGVNSLIDDAIAQGAVKHAAGTVAESQGPFVLPTILTGVTKNMRIAQEEIFGPVVAVTTFSTDAEAIEMINDTDYGLASYVYTSNVARCWKMARNIKSGMIGINEGAISTVVAPFGGVKDSGYGREGGRQGIGEYTELKYVCFGGLY